jgi:glycosyltransferase involved in cell wall biosynthesis
MTQPLWVVLPVYNEESCVEAVAREWIPVLRELSGDFVLLALNDGSTDGTLSILERLQLDFSELRVLDKPNAGHGQSCIQGYRIALDAGAEWIFQIDSDGQCDPRFFGGIWRNRSSKPIQYGYRRSRDDGHFRSLVSRLVTLVTWIATGVWVRDANVPYRLMHRSRLESVLDAVPSDFHLANILLAVLQQRQFGIDWADIHFRQRMGGVPSARLGGFARHGLDLFRQLRHGSRAPEGRAGWPLRRSS